MDFRYDVIVLGGLSDLELAQVESTRGNLQLARGHYQRFLELYDMPSPRMRHLVEEARIALANLK
jgi:hypothetical protein